MSKADLEKYVKSYNIAVFRLMACGRAAPTEARLERFEEAIAYRYPEEFRDLTLSPLGGLCFEVLDDLWPRNGGEEEWMKLYDVKVFGLAAGAPQSLDLERQLALFPPHETDLIPFMSRGSEAARYCFDLDNQIVRWSPDGTRETCELGLYDLIVSEFRALEERWTYYRESAGKKKKARKKKKAATGA